MISFAEKYKGIHPGLVLERELKKRSLKQRPFALAIGEHPQTLNSIIKGKRGLATALALVIEEKLGLEEGSLVMLQAFYEIEKAKEGQSSKHLIFLFYESRFSGIRMLKASIGTDSTRP